MNARLPEFLAPEDGVLDDAMQRAFHDDGAIVLRDFVSAEDCAALQRRARELVDGFDPHAVQSVFSTTTDAHQADDYFLESGDKIRFFLEDDAFDAAGELTQAKHDSLNKMGHAMHDLDPVFDRFSRTPKLAAVAASVGLRSPAIIQSMYIFKPPHIGAEVVCHQDSTYIFTEPDSCVGLWFALEDATIDNGCLYFIPGGHKPPLKRRNRRLADGSMSYEVFDPSPFPEHLKVPVETPAGTLVVFTGRAPHLSGPNRSARSRHAYSLHVIDRECRYPDDNWLQRRADLPLRGFDS